MLCNTLFRCSKQSYNTSDLNVSVVICFYNEHEGTLYRTIQSVLDRSPETLLHEVIVVDDSSDIGEFRYVNECQHTS